MKQYFNFANFDCDAVVATEGTKLGNVHGAHLKRLELLLFLFMSYLNKKHGKL